MKIKTSIKPKIERYVNISITAVVMVFLDTEETAKKKIDGFNRKPIIKITHIQIYGPQVKHSTPPTKHSLKPAQLSPTAPPPPGSILLPIAPAALPEARLVLVTPSKTPLSTC